MNNFCEHDHTTWSGDLLNW